MMESINRHTVRIYRPTASLKNGSARKTTAKIGKKNEEFSIFQLMELCAGVSIAWKIGRKFYVSNAWRHKNAEKAIEELKSWFPRLRESIKNLSVSALAFIFFILYQKSIID